jgi:acyl-CoA synthetase (NDP forming)
VAPQTSPAAREKDDGAEAAVWLRPEETQRVLAAYGIAMPETRFATTADDAARLAAEVGFPVALKLASDSITHKSDVGGVVLDVRTADEARRAFAGIGTRLAAAGERDAMRGVVVQPMIREGVEAVIGVTRDPSFGPLVMFGLGGVQVELLKDVAFRVHPLTDRDAREMVREIRGAALFEGWRGGPPADLPAVEQALLRVSQLVEDHPEIVEMDLNPIQVRPRGRGCVVLDARIAVAPSAATTLVR